jgi:calcium-dependent protein kinase
MIQRTVYLPRIVNNMPGLKNDHGHEKISTNMISNMKKFKVGRKLKQAATNFIVTQLVSKDERNKLLKQFKAWDSNGDGVLSRDEIYQGYKSLYGEVKANEEVVSLLLTI